MTDAEWDAAMARDEETLASPRGPFVWGGLSFRWRHSQSPRRGDEPWFSRIRFWLRRIGIGSSL